MGGIATAVRTFAKSHRLKTVNFRVGPACLRWAWHCAPAAFRVGVAPGRPVRSSHDRLCEESFTADGGSRTGELRGSLSALMEDGQLLGAVLRTRDHVKPVYALVPALMSKHLTIQKAGDLWKVIDSEGRVFDAATSRDEAEEILDWELP